MTNNDITSYLEVGSFEVQKPTKYTCYMAKDKVTTWSGETLARITWRKSTKWRGTLSNERVYFDAVGINGVKYYGRGFGDGICCRIYANKVQS